MDLVSRYLSKLYAIITAEKFHIVRDTTPSIRVVQRFELLSCPYFQDTNNLLLFMNLFNKCIPNLHLM
jgi:hypothetical protein